MIEVLKHSWALLLGMLLLMLGNGLQGSLLGVRGTGEGFSAFHMSVVMSAYFVGFLLASRLTPGMIRRVGHVRVFAALASFISAVLILYPAFPHPITWTIERMIIGFCYCGVYVTAESWLNNASSNQSRGQALSLYMIVQMMGVIAAQALLLIPDTTGFLLFVIPSVLVSIAFAPILLSVSPTPAFDTTRRMSLIELYRVSPLGFVGMFLLGGVYAAQFGMSAVFAAEAGLKLTQISMFVASFYVGALVTQYPLGWLSDRMDRRKLVAAVAFVGGIASLLAAFAPGNFYVLVAAAFFAGGAANPLYSLLIAYTNDFLPPENMAAASAGLLFVNGVGAIAGPIVTGFAIQKFGPGGFFGIIALLMLGLTVYAGWRMTRRPAPKVADTSAYTAVTPSATPVAVEVAQEVAIEAAEAAEAAVEDAEGEAAV
ncbi:MFS transporter [Salipiger aestuarii]|uniref:MFS transporter n=1 Tax=Salipiger aestuarii TaxID=568098 RepID=A0A327XQM8_9RHOB|nr:MFS transporter [Salipiger aestuarii]EIE51401.1 major facilitator superfamily protein, putative [Citreicella sp. 357]KAA8605678.1 MFS transporter [Salipiger aestuarii]KAA8612841.1 MFS transporter [Salipiger aestuarii]KAB2539836.1 MFS transporter [Salipiger aestuarii]RAK10984.1 MFS transporter [Salipiger aestuarii]